MKGAFITTEGIDGSNKSTVAQMLVEHLRQKGFQVRLTAEPAGTELGKRICELLFELFRVNSIR